MEEIRYWFDQTRLVVSHLEVRLLQKPLVPKNIWYALKGPQRQLRKEDLFVQYDKKNNINLILDPLTIKYLPKDTKLLR